MKWDKKEIDASQVKDLGERYRIDLLTASVLARREVDGSSVKFYLEQDPVFLHNPFLFDDMESAVDRIFEAADEGEKVRIFGDRDVDGMTSTVLLKEAFDELGIESSWRVPQEDAPYGLTMEGVDELVADDVTLLVTVDCGISNNAEIAYAARCGIDAIVVDHHLPGEELPPAVAIIDPKIEGTGYPFPHLAGCGVVAKLVWALRFGRTELYKQEIVLLHAHPGNETVIIDAVKLENLVEIDRISEHVVPGVLPAEQSKLFDFLVGKQILVYDEPLERKMLQQAFGTKVEINLIDIAPGIWEIFPKTQGKSLLRMQQQSRAKRYLHEQMQEIDALVSVFHSFVVKSHQELSSGYDELLDLVAIGTVADLMPMRGENRLLVKRGLKMLAAGKREALTSFLAAVNLAGKRISTVNIGWHISPVFNAAGRMGVPDVAVSMLLSKDRGEQSELASELIALNKRRKKLGDESWNRIIPKAYTSFEQHGNKIVIVYDKEVNRGITGIMASRLVNTFKVPAIVIAKLDTHLVGSMRSNKTMNVKQFLGRFEDLLLDHGGHQCAGGFSLKEELLDEFLIRVDEAAEELVESESEDHIYIDAEIPAAYMQPSLIELVELLEPYGEDHPPLQFMMRGAKLEEITLMGNNEQKHVRMLVSYGQYKWPAVFWRAGDRVGVDFTRGDTVDIVFRFGRNYYKNSETLQLTVLDIAKDAAARLTNR
ncbi:MAG: single-stranded-DNA-specific exonuclease RecJ [Spirochaetota bacterium]